MSTTARQNASYLGSVGGSREVRLQRRKCHYGTISLGRTHRFLIADLEETSSKKFEHAALPE